MVLLLLQWDKTGQLVRKFCPELKDFPDKYIYEPWLAPEAVQKKAVSFLPAFPTLVFMDKRLAC